ncbi:MAG TPA: TetR/AcrR family transcriptional regulator [Mycobacterium sp.]|nr:TetR/AcrR family transcriptional regulator [Mycobacterium sp.]
MAATPTARRKLLDAAAELFYREGVGATGVDRISAEAGVSKRSLYQHFQSKDALIAAALADKGAAVLDRYIPADRDSTSAREKILDVFDTLRTWSCSADFRGCPFANVATELTDPTHPARAVARDYKLRLRSYLAHQAEIGGARDPDALAEQLLMLFDGAIANAMINNGPVPDGAHAAAEILLDAHGLVSERLQNREDRSHTAFGSS